MQRLHYNLVCEFSVRVERLKYVAMIRPCIQDGVCHFQGVYSRPGSKSLCQQTHCMGVCDYRYLFVQVVRTWLDTSPPLES